MDNNETANIGMKVTAVLKKFYAKPDGSDWTDEELEAGLADDYLYEKITTEDGIIIDTWRKEN